MKPMKKVSKVEQHALAELNITPLLDLAFVLLVIFIITTTPVVNDLDVDLPSAARRPKEPKSNVHYVTVQTDGKMYLDQKEVDMPGLQDGVMNLRMDNPAINIIIRGSARVKYRRVVDAMDVLQQCNVGKVNLATEAFGDKP